MIITLGLHKKKPFFLHRHIMRFVNNIFSKKGYFLYCFGVIYKRNYFCSYKKKRLIFYPTAKHIIQKSVRKKNNVNKQKTACFFFSILDKNDATLAIFWDIYFYLDIPLQSDSIWQPTLRQWYVAFSYQIALECWL